MYTREWDIFAWWNFMFYRTVTNHCRWLFYNYALQWLVTWVFKFKKYWPKALTQFGMVGNRSNCVNIVHVYSLIKVTMIVCGQFHMQLMCCLVPQRGARGMPMQCYTLQYPLGLYQSAGQNMSAWFTLIIWLICHAPSSPDRKSVV